ncbi:hypothetical protein Acsp02_93330 [Actinoplanes sp. NBRC 103695]|nr:hypothetical protein Acsp02_93330 [Actinoplanes sp. NBRC 103695]
MSDTATPPGLVVGSVTTTFMTVRPAQVAARGAGATSIDQSGTVRVWDPDTGAQTGPVLIGHAGVVTSNAAPHLK